MKRGLFVVLEGLEKCGKKTQSKLLKSYLESQGIACVEIEFPTRDSIIGQMIQDHKKDLYELHPRAVHLLFSAHRWEKQKEIENELRNGKCVICSRYVYSAIAYSCANGLDHAWCSFSEKEMLKPDLVVYLQIDPKELKKRISSYDIKSQTHIASFMDLILKEPVSEIVDASMEIEFIHFQICGLVNCALAHVDIHPEWIRF